MIAAIQRQPVLSRTAEYALSSVIHIAQRGPGASATAAELAGSLGIPESYLSKTLRALSQAHLLVATRGRHGGFALAVPAEELRVADVIAPFGDAERRYCLLGRGVCSDKTACPAHRSWKPTAEQIARFFRERTVAELAGDNSREELTATD